MSIYSEPKADFNFRTKDWVFCHMKQNCLTLGTHKEGWAQGCTSHKNPLPHADSLVKLDGAPFKAFAAQRERWAIETDYVYPGPIQYFGPTEVCDQATKTLQLEQGR